MHKSYTFTRERRSASGKKYTFQRRERVFTVSLERDRFSPARGFKVGSRFNYPSLKDRYVGHGYLEDAYFFRAWKWSLCLTVYHYAKRDVYDHFYYEVWGFK